MNLLVTTKTVDENDQLLGFFVEWIRLFSDKFEKVTIFCLEKGKFDLPEKVKVTSIGKYKGTGKLKTLFSLWLLSFKLRNNYDAVFVHMNPIWMIVGGLLWKILNKNRFFWYTSGGVTFKLKLAEKFADTVFTASKESFRLSSKKVIVTGHGIDTELFRLTNNQQPTTNNKVKILSVGRIAPIKNYETLVKAAKMLKDKGVDFSITIVGETPFERDKEYEKNLKSLIAVSQLQNYFNFVGKVEHKDLPEYYQSHDIFVHLSKTGSLDKTILEAMACGIKVLSSNDSSRTFLPDNLIFGEDNPIELTSKILIVKDLAVDPKFRHYVVQNHNLGVLIEKISNYIQRSSLKPISK